MARYDEIGEGYARERRADPRIAARIAAALGGARTVVNIGAGSGNYEPVDRRVVAVEPSCTMIEQRPSGAAQARERCCLDEEAIGRRTVARLATCLEGHPATVDC